MLTRVVVPEISTYLQPRAISFDELDALVRALDRPDTQKAACASLHELAAALEDRRTEQNSNDIGLRLFRLQVPGCSEPIRLILHPAVFEPELWGKTFAEGLLKEPDIFSGKSIVELGTGSGWISILMLKRTYAKKILGLDLNPVAVAIARLNTWLNGSDADGRLKTTPAGIPLVEAFKVAESDLLQEPLGRKEKFDHVIGCIPQVLHPDPGSLKSQRHDSAQDLYDLSNYCFEQGILEDRFGLPLIARALEQAQLCINPGGMLTLILGGRPGLEAIDGVFRRRGYLPKLWWSRRIQQADDTDLASLVALEREHGIKFHFYSAASSKRSIPASTAIGLLERNRPLFHDLLVMQATTKFEKPMLGFVRNINALGLSDLRKELDLSAVSDEQISFLERLTQDLLKNRTLPYPHERGDSQVRDKIAKFLRTYCNFVTRGQDIFIGPERSQLVQGILSFVASPGEKVLLSSSVADIYSRVVSRLKCESVFGNDDLSELVDLDELFEPRISIISPVEMADPSPLVLQTFINQALKHPNRWYLIDDSRNFDIGSELRSNVMLRILAQQTLPPNLVFLYGLIKNTVERDLELSFTINAPDTWIDAMDVSAELSYSRIAYPTQLYYEWLFDNLLSFPFPDITPDATVARAQPEGQVTPWFQHIAEDPIFMDSPIDLNDPDLVRLDYGEFEAPVPRALSKGLIKGFLEPYAVETQHIVANRVAAYVKYTRNAAVSENRIVLGQGVFPLLGSLIETMRARLGRAPVVALPQGSYGPSFALVEYHGGTVVEIETDPEQGFLLTLQGIARMTEKPDLLWLTQPNNPSGLFFSSDTVTGIMQLCAERGIYVLADEVFFLLSDSKLGAWTPPQLSFGGSYNGAAGKWLFLVDGLSKSCAAGGLRCGFMVCPDATWAKEIREMTFLPPKSTLRAWDSLYSVFLEQSPHDLMDVSKELAAHEDYLKSARALLDDQRDKLLNLLSEHSLSDRLDGARRGGLFVLARLGDQRDLLAKEQKILINGSPWARTPGWGRICFSLEPARFNTALSRLANFLQAHHGQR